MSSAKETYFRFRLHEETKKQLFSLAKLDGRTASNYLEQLIKREAMRAGMEEMAKKEQSQESHPA